MKRLLWSRREGWAWMIAAAFFAAVWVAAEKGDAQSLDLAVWIWWPLIAWPLTAGLESLCLSGVWAKGGYIAVVNRSLLPTRQYVHFDQLATVERWGKKIITHGRYGGKYESGTLTRFTLRLRDGRKILCPPVQTSVLLGADMSPILVAQSKRRHLDPDGPSAFYRIAWDMLLLRLAIPAAVLVLLHPWTF